MTIFAWYEKYSVDNEELDEHHKALFDILNRLYENSLDKNNAKCIKSIIEELVSYSDYHFAAEEQHMSNIEYEDIKKHIIEHRGFTQEALQLQQVVDKDEPEATKELIVFLGNWLLYHVLSEDKKYSA